MVISDAEANVAWVAGETVMILEEVDVRPQASVNVHDSV